MKVQLRYLRAVNCGPLDDVCIDFCDSFGKPQPVIMLTGANGSGKTTVLELIFAFCEMLDPGWDYARISPFAEKPKTILDKTSYAQLDLLINDEAFSICYGKPDPDARVARNYIYRGGTDYDRIYGEAQLHVYEAVKQAIGLQRGRYMSLSDNDESDSSINPAKAGNTLLPSVLYFPVNRFVNRTEGKLVQREDTIYHWTYRYEPVTTYEASLDSYLIWLDYAEPERFTRVLDFLAGLDINGKRFGIQRKDLRAIVTTPDGKTHGLDELSSGEQHILIMLLELYRRLLPGSIVLIDEIENSLHPAFQYRFARLLKRMQETMPFQLIVTTHAPAFVEIFGEETVRILTEF